MSTSYVSRKLKTYSAKNFRDSFTYSPTNVNSVGYVFIGKTTPFANNDPVPDDIVNSVVDEKLSWDTMIAAKKISPGDIEFVIPLQRWTANTRYKQYDDVLPLDDLLSTSIDGSDTVYPMYVINSENNVYKCLCNNVNGFSMVEPTGNYSENDGFIQTEAGGTTCYLWKYMYNIRESNKFFTDIWMPVPFPVSNVSTNDYDLNETNLVDGALAKIKVITSGTGYVHSSLNVSTFAANSSVLVITDDIVLANSNVKLNMAVTGTGILNGTYITGVYSSNNRIAISQPTIGSGGGAANTLSVVTRVAVAGDGFGVDTLVRLSNTGGVRKIDVTSIGQGYSRANVTIYGSGTGATARAILPPKFGHGKNPALELGANSIMIVQRIGEVDATENGLISTNTSFRQYGVVVNPYKYSSNSVVTYSTANGVISQVTDIVVLSGGAYTRNEFVYQGSVSSPTFSGYVVTQTSNTISLIQVVGAPQIGGLLIGANSTTSRAISDVLPPDLLPYTGDILYAHNITEVQRSDGQAEEIKLVFKF